jgi:hypothetical protein
MSDTSQGPGWWLASDGKWYPPETWAGAVPQTGAATGPAGGPGYPSYQGGPIYAARPTNGLAVAALVCSCAGWLLLGLPCVLGIIFGFVARGQIKRSNGHQQGEGMALAGIIVGFSLIALFILFVIVVSIVAHHTTCTYFGDQRTCRVN